jgi:hypothetical protein
MATKNLAGVLELVDEQAGIGGSLKYLLINILKIAFLKIVERDGQSDKQIRRSVADHRGAGRRCV